MINNKLLFLSVSANVVFLLLLSLSFSLEAIRTNKRYPSTPVDIIGPKEEWFHNTRPEAREEVKNRKQQSEIVTNKVDRRKLTLISDMTMHNNKSSYHAIENHKARPKLTFRTTSTQMQVLCEPNSTELECVAFGSNVSRPLSTPRNDHYIHDDVIVEARFISDLNAVDETKDDEVVERRRLRASVPKLGHLRRSRSAALPPLSPSSPSSSSSSDFNYKPVFLKFHKVRKFATFFLLYLV